MFLDGFLHYSFPPGEHSAHLEALWQLLVMFHPPMTPHWDQSRLTSHCFIKLLPTWERSDGFMRVQAIISSNKMNYFLLSYSHFHEGISDYVASQRNSSVVTVSIETVSLFSTLSLCAVVLWIWISIIKSSKKVLVAHCSAELW